MTKSGLLGAAAVVIFALAGPAMAQQVITKPGHCAQNANCQDKGPGNRDTGDYQHQTADRHNGNWNNSYNRWDSERGNDSGFWPGDVAGAAVGTAAGIATAPIGGEAYARQNGFVCIPGTWFKGEDGRRHICQ
jgi:hypothetical protein